MVTRFDQTSTLLDLVFTLLKPSITSEWMQEWHSGAARFKATRRMHDRYQIEEVGEKLRDMMPWIKGNALVDKDKN